MTEMLDPHVRPSLPELLSLHDRTAVVTGGARGLGAAVARRLAEAGADVFLVDNDDKEVHGAARQLSDETGRSIVAVVADVADAESLTLAAAVPERLDIWINNAGVFPVGRVESLSTEAWDNVMAVNLRGAFVGAQAAARRLIDAGRGGVIVNVSSTAGLRGGRPGGVAYVASKHGVQGLTKALAHDLGAHGIRVLAVAPGVMRTPGQEALLRSELGGAVDTAEILEILEGIGTRLPLGRAVTPDEVARVVLFCASDLATMMTGTTLVVDGGSLA